MLKLVIKKLMANELRSIMGRKPLNGRPDVNR
jgi:hypothetical protein